MPHDPLGHQDALYTSANPTRRRLHRQRRNLIIRCLQSCGGPTCKASLEIGPGSCIYVPTLLQLSEQVTAADIEPAFLDRARDLAKHEPRLTVIGDDITRSQLPPGHYSLILCTEVIEHLTESSSALATMADLLHADGHLVLSTPQRWSIMESCARIALLPGIITAIRWLYQESVEPTGHINLLTEKQLLRQCQAAGLRITQQHRLGCYLPFIAEFGGLRGARWLARLEKSIAGSRWSWMLWTQLYILKKSNPRPHV